ncbi:Asp-tRNA(Asn)/Glu-tRNA(Gln) amidotransferase subunit GatC [Patescibacteria group bacterium]|nr:Asp-tRNA(Asn)/Glu-tRNA(Gln) amidotransferase subunit GatC [Patescibacteria group bacterium]
MLEKNDLEKLAELSRMEVEPAEEEKLLKDLGGILDHFEELKAVPTDGVKPMTGGTETRNIYREDEEGNGLTGEEAKKGFPEEEKDYLKVPPVFE